MIWQQNQISWDFKLTGNSNEKLRSKNEKVLLFENFVRNDTETNKAGPNGGLTRLHGRRREREVVVRCDSGPN